MIDGYHLKRAIYETENLLAKERDVLNAINVFPVADGDTGTNLYLTVSGIRQSIADMEDRRASVVADAIARASLYHAKGNSGVIFSQFLWGFREGVNGKEVLGVRDLAVALASGTSYAYKAVAQPVEGTMLTVMRAVSDWANRFRRAHLGRFLKGLFQRATEALALTPHLLAKIGKPSVVDSGAYGFVLYLEGLLRAVGLSINYKRPEKVEVKREKGNSPLYCSNFLVEGGSEEEIRQLALQLGDSVVVVGNNGLFKVHLHTSDPEKAEEALSSVGRIVKKWVEPIW